MAFGTHFPVINMALEFYQFIKTHAQAQLDHPAIIDGETTITLCPVIGSGGTLCRGAGFSCASSRQQTGPAVPHSERISDRFTRRSAQGPAGGPLQLYADVRRLELYHSGCRSGSSGGESGFHKTGDRTFFSPSSKYASLPHRHRIRVCLLKAPFCSITFCSRLNWIRHNLAIPVLREFQISLCTLPAPLQNPRA